MLRQVVKYLARNRHLLASIAAVVTFLGSSPVEAKAKMRETKLCPRVVLYGPEEISFTNAERFLVCGDPQSTVWNNIPNNQATFHLKTFLQDRGYFNPQFKASPERIVVELGKPSTATSFKADGEPRDVPISRLRNIVGVRLTPKLLDSAKDRLHRMLESRGYPCPDVTIEADPDTGEILAHLKGGPRQNVVKVNEEKIEGLDPGVMSRYWAFVLGAPYNGDLLTVTTHRVTDDALVQSTYFTAACEPEGAVLHQQSVAGPPRVVTIGLGVDTEQLIITRASWKNARLGDMGSSLSLTANASLKIQELTADGNWYYHRKPKRSYLQPTLNIRHENEQHFENLTGRARFAPATTWDSQTLGVRASIGPTMTWTHTYRGEGPRDSQFLSLNANVHLFNHYYELYRDRPQTGFSATLDSDFAEHDWLSSVSARTIRGNLEGLLNVGNFDPPFLVFGFRGGLATTFTDEKLSSATRLPPLFRQWLGGSTDLRGFGRQELPGKTGALTAMYAGIELRLADSLPFGLQPFVFADAGALGTESFSLDSPIFWDPGIGLRWQAPFGVIRTTLAQGFMAGNTAGWDPKLKHPQFYFSFGEEF